MVFLPYMLSSCFTKRHRTCNSSLSGGGHHVSNIHICRARVPKVGLLGLVC